MLSSASRATLCYRSSLSKTTFKTRGTNVATTSTVHELANTVKSSFSTSASFHSHSTESSSSAFAKMGLGPKQKIRPALDLISPATRALHNLERAVESQDLVYAMKTCTSIKKNGIEPTLRFYQLLCQLFSDRDMTQEIEALFEDATLMGIEPDREMWNYLLKGRSINLNSLLKTIEDMRAAGHELNSTSYRHIVLHYTQSDNIAMCLRTLQEMKTANVVPDIITMDAIINLACQENLPRMACQLAKEFEKESFRRLTPSTWVQILAASASSYYSSGVVEGWDRVVKDGEITPDEGLCTLVLNASGVAGLVSTAEGAVEKIKTSGATIEEYHVAPLIAALAYRNQIEAALAVFQFMEDNQIQPTPYTARPLQKLLQKSSEAMETAITYLRHNAETKKRNLTTAFNCILAATLRFYDNHTIALGQEMDTLYVNPSTSTFNILIHGAANRRNPELAHAYFEEIGKRGLEPDKETFERIIVLLTGQPAYDDAFLYLEKMLSVRIVPSKELLVGLAKKCSLKYDVRWKMCVQRMERYGYEVSDSLMAYLLSNGLVPMHQEELESESLPSIEAPNMQIASDSEWKEIADPPRHVHPEFL